MTPQRLSFMFPVFVYNFVAAMRAVMSPALLLYGFSMVLLS